MIFFPVNKGTFSMRIIETYLRRLKTPLLRPILLALHESTFPPSRACKIQTVETRVEFRSKRSRRPRGPFLPCVAAHMLRDRRRGGLREAPSLGVVVGATA